jgi:hypothetical protein
MHRSNQMHATISAVALRMPGQVGSPKLMAYYELQHWLGAWVAMTSGRPPCESATTKGWDVQAGCEHSEHCIALYEGLSDAMQKVSYFHDDSIW